MDNVFSIIGLRSLWSAIGMTAMAAFTPTINFVVVMTIAFLFNIGCGMRADGVINIRCRNFSWEKFRFAIVEYVLLLMVIEMIALMLHTMGDEDLQHYVCKIAGYVVSYYYVCNGIKNLCKCHPRSKILWMVYLLVRLDFRRFLKIDELIDNYEKHLKRNADGTYTTDIDNI